MSTLTVEAATSADDGAIADLWAAQRAGWHAADPRLPPPPRPAEVIPVLASQREAGTPLVVRAGAGVLCGYVAPRLMKPTPESGMRIQYADRTGVPGSLTVAPSAESVEEVLDVLLAALEEQWRAWEVGGLLTSRPAFDTAVAAALARHGFARDSHHALRPTGAGGAVQPEAPHDLRARAARRDDTAAIVALHLGEIDFHVGLSPFVRSVPESDAVMRALLERVWEPDDAAPRAPFAIVVEADGAVVGMEAGMGAPVPRLHASAGGLPGGADRGAGPTRR